ncbi:MAG: hypothetical protein OHK0031_19390 [Anaerolineales bacterium]
MRFKHFFLLLTILLAACSGVPAAAETPAPSATPRPTVGPTPTPGLPLAILFIPADLNEETSNAYQSAVYDLAQSAGMRFQVRNQLSAADLEPELKIVVALPPAAGLRELAAAAPQAQFLAVNVPDVSAGGNLSTLSAAGIRIDQQAFIAGFIAAITTEDYRSGVITRKDTPESAAIQAAFRAGQEFFCGLCNPYAGPFEEYPLAIEIPADAKPAEYGAYADFLLRKQVSTLFLQPGIDAPELLDYLTIVGAFTIGAQTPAKAYPNWVVTLQPNYLDALKSVWPQLLTGQGGQNFAAPLTFTDINEEIFTPGKQNLAAQTLRDLNDGFISTGVQP